MPLNPWFDGGDETKATQRERSFRVKRSYPKILRNRKRRIQRRLDPERGWSDQAEPIMKASNIHYEMAEKARAVNCGGIGAIHLMVNKLGLRQEIDSRLHLLKKHLPYHESDHVLNLTYNALLDGVRLEDIELRRNDEAFLDGLGAQRIPDPTTSGDFTRRFEEADILDLMEITNTVRQRVWRSTAQGLFERGPYRHRRHDCADFRGMQRRHGSFLQRHLGLCPAGGLPGQHQRSALSGQPSRQCREP